MTDALVFESRIKAQFGLLNKSGARRVPAATSLSTALSAFTPLDEQPFAVTSEIPKLFITASTDAWQRSIHSFLVSIALTECSPLWSGVCGYYASHYAVRAFAHLFGCYLLFNKKRMVELTLANGIYSCAFRKKKPNDREHQAYWRRLVDDSPIKSDQFFRENVGNDSEISHRDRANYADHLTSYYKTFLTLDKDTTLRRIDRISKIQFAEPPFPRMSKFVDLESVQIVAYHRIVKYRKFVDETLGSTSRYWNVSRNPSFSAEFIDFQLTESNQLAGIYN
jgi:hypothetical protein